MANQPPLPLYWDSSCFLCFLNENEGERRETCEDILQNARQGNVKIYTSCYAMTEVIRPKSKSLPGSRKLTHVEAERISKMFQWPFITPIEVDERVGLYAAQLARDYGLQPADAVHAASAILGPPTILQRWDRDFDRVGHLIKVEEPRRISNLYLFPTSAANPIGPHPDEFKNESSIPGDLRVSLKSERQD